MKQLLAALLERIDAMNQLHAGVCHTERGKVHDGVTAGQWGDGARLEEIGFQYLDAWTSVVYGKFARAHERHHCDCEFVADGVASLDIEYRGEGLRHLCWQ